MFPDPKEFSKRQINAKTCFSSNKFKTWDGPSAETATDEIASSGQYHSTIITRLLNLEGNYLKHIYQKRAHPPDDSSPADQPLPDEHASKSCSESEESAEDAMEHTAYSYMEGVLTNTRDKSVGQTNAFLVACNLIKEHCNKNDEDEVEAAQKKCKAPQHPILIMTGVPGSGKSFIYKCIAQFTENFLSPGVIPRT